MSYYDEEERDEKISFWITFTAFVLMIAVEVFLLCGCSTVVVPREVAATQASFSDDGRQDSGIITSVPGGWYVTAGREAEYNSLIDVYGSQFSPALKHNDGVRMEGPNIFMDDEHDVDMKLMQAWKRSATHQPRTLIEKATGL